MLHGLLNRFLKLGCVITTSLISTTEQLLSLVYRIDAKNQISSVNEAWKKFASENSGDAGLPGEVWGSDLIDSISDHTTKELYLSMIRQVRQEHQVEFQYRCDAPDKRRLFSMRITRTPGGEVEFVSTLWNEKIRRSVSCLESDQPRSDAFLRVCRGCQQGMARF